MRHLESITFSDLTDLAHGATFLGSGGGGDPSADCLLTESILNGESLLTESILNGESLLLKQLSQCNDEEMVVLVAGIGAPLVSCERLFSGEEWVCAINLVEQAIGKPIENVVAAEIGGQNAFSGLLAAITAKKQLLDADSLGRAFPTINISSCALHFLPITPAVLVDGLGNAAIFHTKTSDTLERHIRAQVTAMGSSAACALYPMTIKTAKKALIRGSLSECVHIGKMLQNNRAEQFVKELSSFKACKWVGRGVVSRIEQEIEGGFLRGRLTIEGKSCFTIEFQNEYLVLFEGLLTVGLDFI